MSHVATKTGNHSGGGQQPSNTTWAEVSDGSLVIMQKDMDQTQPDWVLVCQNQDVVRVKVVRD